MRLIVVAYETIRTHIFPITTQDGKLLQVKYIYLIVILLQVISAILAKASTADVWLFNMRILLLLVWHLSLLGALLACFSHIITIRLICRKRPKLHGKCLDE